LIECTQNNNLGNLIWRKKKTIIWEIFKNHYEYPPIWV